MAQAAARMASIFLPERATVVEAKQLSATEKWFRLKLPEGRALGHQPGQFVEVTVFGVGEAPTSVSSPPTQKESFEICMRRVGMVTEALHRLEAGATVGIRGPFGRGFDIEAFSGRDALIVAGGLGIIPLRSLIKFFLDKRDIVRRLIVFYGCKTPEELLFRDELHEWELREDIDLRTTIDRKHPQWQGHVGVVTTLFPEVKLDGPNTTAAVVGPPVMFRFTILECLKAGIPEEMIFLSLERHMKCGVGKCGHCQIDGRYVCLDGPVFRYSEIKRVRGAI